MTRDRQKAKLNLKLVLYTYGAKIVKKVLTKKAFRIFYLILYKIFHPSASRCDARPPKTAKAHLAP